MILKYTVWTVLISDILKGTNNLCTMDSGKQMKVISHIIIEHPSHISIG